jgi:hypothetical protein
MVFLLSIVDEVVASCLVSGVLSIAVISVAIAVRGGEVNGKATPP